MKIDRIAAAASTLIVVGAAWISSPALSQGPMAPTPRPPDVRPPTTAAPTAPTVAPAPHAPIATPVIPAPQTPRSGGGADFVNVDVSNRDHLKQPIGNGLPGVSTTWTGPGGRGGAVTDAKGVLSLGSLPQGSYDLTLQVPTRSGNQPAQQRVLIGLLLPAVQKVRGVAVPSGAKVNVKFDVSRDGTVTTAKWSVDGGVTHEDTWDQQRLPGLPSGTTGGTTFALVEANNLLMEVSTTR